MPLHGADPRISVIVPTLGRGPLLATALDSLARQPGLDRGVEVIVVDNGHEGETRRVCEAIGPALPAFQYVREPAPGLHAARHRGVSASRGEILAFLDDDVRLSARWLHGVLDLFASPAVLLGTGNCQPELEAPAPSWFDRLWQPVPGGRVNGWHSLVELGTRRRTIDPEHVYGCNFLIARRALEQSGGFHPDGMPASLVRFRGDGETAVSRALRGRGVLAHFHPDASLWHRVSRERLTLEYLEQRAFLQGISESFAWQRQQGLRSLGAYLAFRLVRLELERRLGWRYPERVAHASGMARGLRFHADEVRRDPALRRWVQRPDYLDADVRALEAGA